MKLYNDQTGELVGEASEEDVQFLIDQLEEEGAEDQAYYINEDTVLMLEENGASDALKGVLRQALAKSGDLDLRWSEE